MHPSTNSKSKMINISLPDGSVRQYESGVTPMDVALSISEGLARNVISATVNDQQVETTTPITTDATIKWVKKLFGIHLLTY